VLDRHFDYFGLRTVYDRYLLRHPHSRKVIETPQQFFLRIACALSEDVPKRWRCTSALGQPRLPAVSSPTLFNAAPPTSSCPRASCWTRRRIRWNRSTRYGDIAQLSKFSGGIGCQLPACARAAR
jgi:ribonucleoside-diphosphate reductase alpha chain